MSAIDQAIARAQEYQRGLEDGRKEQKEAYAEGYKDGQMAARRDAHVELEQCKKAIAELKEKRRRLRTDLKRALAAVDKAIVLCGSRQ